MKRKLTRAIIALSLALAMLCVSVPGLALAGAEQYAVVSNTSYLNLRQGPSSGSTWLGRAFSGDWVRVLGAEGNFYYVQIVSSGLYGYMSKNYLKIGSTGGAGNTGVVNNPISTQFLNLRQYPSYSAPVLGIYYNGTAFTILSSADGWYYVNVNGVLGYFRSEYVRVSGGGSEGTAVIRTSNGGPLNLRSAPSASASVSGSFTNGRAVHVLLKGNTFWQVTIDGISGFMMSKYLTASGGGTTPANPPSTKGYAVVKNPGSSQKLNLREQPSTSARIIAQYGNGIRMEVVSQGAEWCKVYGSASGNIGYMMTSYLTLHGLPSVPTKTVQNGSTFVNLRSAPSKTSGTIYTRVYSGAAVTLLAPGDEWSKVQYNGMTGYMMSVFLK